MKRICTVLASGILALLGTVAPAGHYVAGQTSGLTVTTINGGGSPSYGAGNCTLGAGGSNASGTVSGTIKTTFTWDDDGPGDLPPEKVIVMESNFLYISATGYGSSGSSSASASNGLDTRFCTNSSTHGSGSGYPPAVGSTATSSGSAPKVMAGGATVEVETTVYGSCSVSNGPYSMQLNYFASVEPVVVGVVGVIDPSDPVSEILIGQRATGSLSSGTTGVSFTGHNWSVAGIKFHSWPISSGQTSASVVEVSSTEWALASPSWRWTTGSGSGNFDVECSATALYNGQSIGSVTGKREVNVYEPYWSFANNKGTAIA